jgi:hypothetical protein
MTSLLIGWSPELSHRRREISRPLTLITAKTVQT